MRRSCSSSPCSGHGPEPSYRLYQRQIQRRKLRSGHQGYRETQPEPAQPPDQRVHTIRDGTLFASPRLYVFKRGTLTLLASLPGRTHRFHADSGYAVAPELKKGVSSSPGKLRSTPCTSLDEGYNAGKHADTRNAALVAEYTTACA